MLHVRSIICFPAWLPLVDHVSKLVLVCLDLEVPQYVDLAIFHHCFRCVEPDVFFRVDLVVVTYAVGDCCFLMVMAFVVNASCYL